MGYKSTPGTLRRAGEEASAPVAGGTNIRAVEAAAVGTPRTAVGPAGPRGSPVADRECAGTL